MGPEVVHVVVGIDSDHNVIAVIVGSHVALSDAVAELGGHVALPEETALVFVVLAVGNDAAVVLALYELIVGMIHQADDAAAAPFVLADHIAVIYDSGESASLSCDAGDGTDAGAAYGGELVEIVAVVGAVSQMGVAVGCRDDARSPGGLGGEVAAVDATGECDGIGRAGEVAAESADAADLYARRAVFGVAAAFGREVGLVGQTVDLGPFVGERESDHAHRHPDVVACRAVERHRGFVGDVAYGGVVDSPARMPQSVAFEAVTSSEQEESKTRFSTTAPAPSAPNNPQARLGVALSHAILKLLIVWPCPSNRPVKG